ncbi:PAS domain S-box protein [Luteolibacter sp. GHJ8]|uniref:histidine kinase n=1 Tax=Luteolibacter rhizosphaerae TaxID=2989719 RepID=A0ABT3FZG0_9BACT|nr:PAS domain S-box protein [Luteolibacter rhizosphaerae]MCW1912979.1 PAS domain S-box protein [Luteolibacter rhizosphaerae]
MSLKPKPHDTFTRSLVIGVLLTVAAVTARWLLAPWLGNRLTLVTLFPAVAVVVWLAGYRAAIIPAVIGFLLCDTLFMDGTWPAVPRTVSAITFAVAITFVIVSGESMRRHRALADARKNLLHTTLQSIGDGVITTDPKGTVTDLNKVASALTGWSLTEAVGRPVTEVFPIINETSRLHVPNPVMRALAENAVVGLANHTLLISKNGTETPIDDSAAPITDSKGSILGGVLIFRDIAERRLTEAKLQQSEQRHRFLAELASATQHLTEAEEIMSTTARMLAQFLAVDRCAYAVVEDEAVFDITGDYGPTVASIVGKWDVAAFGPECVRRMLANEPFVVEDVDADTRVADSTAAYRATSIRAVICVPLFKDGKFTAAMAVHQTIPRKWSSADIEVVRVVVSRCWESLERARSNRALKASAERLTLALAAAQLGDWSWDAGTDIVDLSPRAAEIFGLDETTEIEWKEMQSLLDPEDAELAKEAVERAMASDSQYDMEYRVNRNGSEVWVAALGRATFKDGIPMGMYGVVQDITPRKALEKELLDQAVELAMADRQKDDFIALLAHELRNPLAPVRTGLELLRVGTNEPNGIERVRSMMERQLNHMVRLVDDLLDVSRITRNKLSLQFEPVLFRDAVSHALETVGPQLESSKQTVRVRLDDPDVIVWADPTRLSQVLGNLLANASKFSPSGAAIEVRGTVERDNAVVSVSDPGIGISFEDLPHVFSIFAQAARSISSSKGGLGLGLHLARSLMELQGGSLEAKSGGLGKGSTFTLSIPTLQCREVDTKEREDRHSGASPLQGMKVLVADDNADALEALSLLLSTLGADVLAARGGSEAISVFQKSSVELILMDVGMPEVDGLQATKLIRSLDGGHRPIIIALTGWGRPEDRDATAEAGCNGHLVKPVKIAELESLIAALGGARKGKNEQ